MTEFRRFSLDVGLPCSVTVYLLSKQTKHLLWSSFHMKQVINKLCRPQVEDPQQSVKWEVRYFTSFRMVRHTQNVFPNVKKQTWITVSPDP